MRPFRKKVMNNYIVLRRCVVNLAGVASLEVFRAPGGPWWPLVAPGGPWWPLAAPGCPWRPLVAPGHKHMVHFCNL